MSLLFVYGSLKEGFPNFHVNRGTRVPGRFRTCERLPFYLVGPGRLPCLLLQPGQGEQVIGQLFEVDEAALAAMDRLERVAEPGGYARASIAVESMDPPGAVHRAFVYVQDLERLDLPGPHRGPVAEYSAEDARHLRW